MYWLPLLSFSPVPFDNEERVTAWSRSDGNQSQTWSLSLVGDWNTHTQTGTNPFTQVRVHGLAHEFLAFTGTSAGALTYDVKGNTTLRPATLAAPTLNLTWDFDNQLSGADTNLSPASQEVSFRYDVLGRRVGRVEGASSVIFVQAGQQTIADYVAGQPPSAPTRVYVYGSYVDEPIARRQSGNLVYFHRNQQYSIVALSDSTGAVIERYSYTAYGQPTIYNAAGTVLAASAFDNRYTYTGREWDATLAMHYFRARWYDPLAGRFLNRDPLGYIDGMGAYAVWFPRTGFDPFGTDWLEDFTSNPFFKWLYAGDSQCPDDIYREFMKSAEEGLACSVECLTDVHKQIVAVMGGSIGAGADASLVMPFPKWVAKLIGYRVTRHPGSSPWTSPARLLVQHKCLPESIRGYLSDLGDSLKNRPGSPARQGKEIIRRLKRGGIAGVASMEILIALYCTEKCGGFGNNVQDTLEGLIDLCARNLI